MTGKSFLYISLKNCLFWVLHYCCSLDVCSLDCQFGSIRQLKINGYFADFGQVRLIVILLPLNKSGLMVILLSLDNSYFADFEQVKIDGYFVNFRHVKIDGYFVNFRQVKN